MQQFASRRTAASAAPRARGSVACGARVRFTINKTVPFGMVLNITGSDEALGAWAPEKFVPLAWAEGDEWSVELDVPEG